MSYNTSSHREHILSREGTLPHNKSDDTTISTYHKPSSINSKPTKRKTQQLLIDSTISNLLNKDTTLTNQNLDKI